MRTVVACLALGVLAASTGRGQTTVEGGALFNPYFLLSDGGRPNAAEGWKLGVTPAVRAERWWNGEGKWRFGVSLVPFYFQTRQELSAPLALSGVEFGAGESIRFRYQFHNARGTAAYRVVQTDRTALRIGGTVLGRYAELRAAGDGRAAVDRNLIAFPAVHVDYRRRLGEAREWVARGDTLPFGLRQGLNDVFVGVEDREDARRRVRFGVGVRLFWGGFSPRERGQNNNEIFFWGPVVRVGL